MAPNHYPARRLGMTVTAELVGALRATTFFFVVDFLARATLELVAFLLREERAARLRIGFHPTRLSAR